MTWIKAIIKVLNENGGVMSNDEITQEILMKGLRNPTHTPSYTVAAYLSTYIQKFGDKSPFERVSPGRFRIVPKNVNLYISKPERDLSSKEILAETNKNNIIKAFGMFWDRNSVNWNETNLKLIGVYSNFIGTKSKLNLGEINFAKQSGVYILYDHRDIIYVGRAVEGSLGVRLKSHTKDRLSNRWNRFSWFGTIAIKEDGKLDSNATADSFPIDKIIPVFEAILWNLYKTVSVAMNLITNSHK